MTEWVVAAVPYFKALHIAALILWCGGLFALPLMLSRHDPAHCVQVFGRIQRVTHLTYTMVVTPAAVVAVVTGTWLIFFREAFVPWLYAKLLFVALLVGAHAWIGHIIVAVAESGRRKRPPAALLPVAAALIPMLAILALVLGKPDLSANVFPDWLTEPRGGQLLFDVPRR
ncbi:MAG: CopD family protein [Azospirillaceae bacterium]